jgi:hypothetical protein
MPYRPRRRPGNHDRAGIAASARSRVDHQAQRSKINRLWHHQAAPGGTAPSPVGSTCRRIAGSRRDWPLPSCQPARALRSSPKGHRRICRLWPAPLLESVWLGSHLAPISPRQHHALPRTFARAPAATPPEIAAPSGYRVRRLLPCEILLCLV